MNYKTIFISIDNESGKAVYNQSYDPNAKLQFSTIAEDMIGANGQVPYLVQRGKIKNLNGKIPIYDAIDLDYMGSAEFEFGALPKSIRRAKYYQDHNRYRVSEISDIKGPQGRSLVIYHTFNDEGLDKYKQALLSHIAGGPGSVRFKEYSDLAGDYKYTDFWWDIENNCFFCFNKNLMNSFNTIIDATVKEYESKYIKK